MAWVDDEADHSLLVDELEPVALGMAGGIDQLHDVALDPIIDVDSIDLCAAGGDLVERELVAFFEHYSRRRQDGLPWRLVINGDMVDFISVCLSPAETDSLLGLSDDDLRSGHVGRIFLVAFIAMLVAAIGFSLLLGEQAGWREGLHWGLVVGLLLVAPALAVHNAFERRPFYFWAINAGYSAVTFVVYGLVLGAWPG